MRPAKLLTFATVAAMSSLVYAEPATRLSRPRFSAIPVAELPRVPDTSAAPSSVSNTERVQGIEVSGVQSPSRSFGRRRSPRVSIPIPRTTIQAQVVLTIKQEREACSSDSQGQISSPLLPRSVFSKLGTGNLVVRPGVHPFRYERLVRSAERAYLEVVDIWVDTATHGARFHQRTEVPLALLASGPRGIEVLGFRDAEHVWMIASVPERGAAIRERILGLSVCGHVRTGLELGSSGSATNVLIGINGDPARMRNELTNGDRFAVAASGFSAVGIAASVSRLSRDSEPVVSVTISPVAPQLRRALASAVVSLGR